MGNVVTGFSMSLDGYIAGPNEDFQYIFKWYESGDTPFQYPNGMSIQVSAISAQVIQETIEATGALICGRGLYNLTNGWDGKHPVDVPVFVITHEAPQPEPGTPFTFVTDGVASAIAQAQAVAGDKNISIASADIARQCYQLGLLDGIHVDLVPFVLGDGMRLFEQFTDTPIELR